MTPEHEAGYLSITECDRWNLAILENFWRNPEKLFMRRKGLVYEERLSRMSPPGSIFNRRAA